MLEKSPNAGMEAKRSDLHRITHFSSSSTELRCALHPSSIHRSETPELRHQSESQRSYQRQEWTNPYKTWDGSLRTSSYPALDLNHAEAKRSQTAPERTGLRLYFSPPAMRRAYQTEQGPLPLSSSNTGWLPLEANLSDDMKEKTHCTRRALEKRRADAACQTVGVAGSVGVTSVALQTEGPTSARPPRRHLSYPPGRVPGQSHCRSPKLQRRVSTPSALPLSSSPSSTLSPSSASLSTSSSVSSSIPSCSGSSGLEGPASSPSWKMRGQNGSAWARSTLPRARSLPVGRSTGVVERGGTAEQPTAGPRAGRGVGGRPEVGTVGGHKRGIVQEFFRSVCGRGQLPAANGLGRGSSNMRGKMERAAPRAAVPPGSDGITSFVNKRLTRNSMREEPGRGGGALGTREKRRSCNAPEDTACDCTSRSLTFCFARPPRSRIPHAPSQCRLRSGECCQPSLGKDSQLMSDVTSGQSQ
ncbi:hypothetical protein GJAV_G00175260 [Gymnothorax javanicus]|nr:hypothetical protein GJAV_G00175260 [Gymnothorax javanicus]